MTDALLHAVGGATWAEASPTAPVVVLLLHGYGSHERDLVPIVTEVGVTAPWASLRAPLELGDGGAAWFAIETLGDPPAAPVEAATAAIWEWVDAHVPATARVLPIGFSQGGFMATQLLRTRPDRVVAPVVLAGFVLGAPQPADERLAADRPALFWGRGDADRVIPVEAVERAGSFLRASSTLVERVYPGLGHGVGAAEVADVRAFIAEQLGADAIG
ncbi:alpha/beta hydrolase [Amnibacterium kyonggiense]|uniref:Phospholipase/carboxylesterase n=1 Tax=Amnibacterium kyonggiense TaxID=595671 RepID=A0A4R7FSV3_9MICO|nr:dienelactone hydrolase family protein [Amnibacterium kyonggiense]TDS80759.1 phospholipase/carboxylesterase [Amnibacterium kyonggiense]